MMRLLAERRVRDRFVSRSGRKRSARPTAHHIASHRRPACSDTQHIVARANERDSQADAAARIGQEPVSASPLLSLTRHVAGPCHARAQTTATIALQKHERRQPASASHTQLVQTRAAHRESRAQSDSGSSHAADFDTTRTPPVHVSPRPIFQSQTTSTQR